MADTTQVRSVPFAVAATVVLQIAAALVWAGAAGERLTHLEARIADQRGLAERVSRLEAQMEAIHGALQRIESKLDGRAAAPDAGRNP